MAAPLRRASGLTASSASPGTATKSACQGRTGERGQSRSAGPFTARVISWPPTPRRTSGFAHARRPGAERRREDLWHGLVKALIAAFGSDMVRARHEAWGEAADAA